jgi:hypothetical protein
MIPPVDRWTLVGYQVAYIYHCLRIEAQMPKSNLLPEPDSYCQADLSQLPKILEF